MRIFRTLLAYAALPIILFINWWVFRWLVGLNYFGWYLDKGALIGAVTGFVALIWEDIDARHGLLSLNPAEFFGSALQIGGVMAFSYGDTLRSAAATQGLGALWDTLASIVLTTAVLVALVLWLFIAAPFTYLLTLIAGAPARQYLRSDRRTLIAEEGNQIRVDVEEGEPDMIDVTMGRKPFAVTQAFIALIILLVELAYNLVF